jgi:hypothetical protein
MDRRVILPTVFAIIVCGVFTLSGSTTEAEEAGWKRIVVVEDVQLAPTETYVSPAIDVRGWREIEFHVTSVDDPDYRVPLQAGDPPVGAVSRIFSQQSWADAETDGVLALNSVITADVRGTEMAFRARIGPGQPTYRIAIAAILRR